MVTKRPQIAPNKADAFIDGAKADTDAKVKRDNVKPLKRKPAKKDEKKTRMTFYMTPELYLRWSQYKVDQLQKGKKVSFQGVVEKYLDRILD